MQHTDKARAEFEAWVTTFNNMPAALFKGDSGGYVDDWIQARWLGWQASRASVVVELPQHDPDSNEPFDVGFCRAIEELRAATVAAGLTVKE